MKRRKTRAFRRLSGTPILFLGLQFAVAQPSVNQEQYLLNPVLLSPSLFIRTTTFSGWYTFRTDRAGFLGRPTLHLVDISGIPGKNFLLDGQLQYIYSNLYRSLYFTLGAGCQVRLGKDAFLTFSLNGMISSKTLDLTDVMVDDPNDPLLVNQQRISQTHFNIGAGITLRISRFAACFSSPMLFNNLTGTEAVSGITELGLQRNFLIYLDNEFRLNREGGFLKPSFLLRQIQQGPLVIDFCLQGGVTGKYWASALYRTTRILGFSAGVGFWQRLLLSYSYEFCTGSSPGASGGSHEITIGYRIQKKDSGPELKDYFSVPRK